MKNQEWFEPQAETNLVWKDDSFYPTQLLATRYKENALGEKRFIEGKTFNLVEAER